jgi:hypothetical protein
VTEAEWLATVYVQDVYAVVRAQLTPTQCLRFTLACGRAYCHIFESGNYDSATAEHHWLSRKSEIDRLCQRALDFADEQLDGADRTKDIESLGNQVFSLAPLGLSWDLTTALRGNISHWVQRAIVPRSLREQAATDAPSLQRKLAESVFQARLLRDIVRNPFRPVVLNPAWQTSNVVALAQSIYEDRAFDRLPILADALEDAGCNHADILNHCRQPEEHVRGCWVVDLVLGKQ